MLRREILCERELFPPMHRADVTTGHADVNGTRLYYETAGRGTPVVFVHGLCLDRRMWDDQFDALADCYRVVRYDVRGFGASAVPTAAEFRHADDLHALLEHLEIPAAHVVGLSMGGRIALHHALLYPESTLTLTLVDSALDGFAWSDEWVASLDAIEEHALRDGAKAGNAIWLQHELFAPARERPAVAAKLAQIVDECSGWNWVNETPVVGIDPPGGARLADVAMPALVVVGERDLPDFLAIADALAAGIPHAKKAVIAGAGHMSNMERPAEFNALLLEFLQAHTATA
ncbi:MAG TPA: alpha/beta fold hydrolase [Candidatus Binatia bacterium]|nr:alpha/beta fold hydrolase [Candidatus Binatia bacterium]